MAVDVRRLRAEILLGGCLALAACGGGSGGRNATATPTRASPTNTATRTATPTAATPTTIPASFTPTPTPTEPMDVPDFTPTPDAASPTPTLAPTDTAMPTLTPTEVPTEVPTSGPVITAFGIADASGALILPTGPPGDPRTFQTQFGSGFIIYVEGRPGPSGLDVGKSTFNRSPFDPRIRPDIQIASSRDLGDGSADSCDNSAPDLGGVPALDPADFSVTQEISDTVNDFSCRFRAFDRSVFPCTQDTSANFAFVDPNTTVQFCTLVSDAIRFPPGNTLLTVRLRDTGGAVGATAAIMIQVAQ